MQIGPIKYSKKEETIFFTSYMLALVLGLPTGILINYVLGIPMQFPNDFGSRVLFFFLWISRLEIVWFFAAAILLFLQYKKQKLMNSWQDIARIVWALFIFFPILLLYIALVMSALFVPLYSATSWLSPIRQYWLGALLFLPFLFLFFVIFLPDQKPRKLIGRLWLILRGKAPIPKPNLRDTVASLLISIWLLLVFLPLPENSLINLIIIAGGLAIVVFLIKHKVEMRKKSKGGALK